jgi:hypothetical protein
MQIPLITCPKCLARIINPNAGRETVARKSDTPQRRPRQVIPLEEEAGGDIRDTTRWLVVLALALFLGAIVIASKIGINTLSVVLIGAGIILAGAIGVIGRKSSGIVEPTPSSYLQHAEREGMTVFDYASAHQEANVGSFLGGFVLAIGLSFVAMIVIAAARDAGRAVAIVVAMVIVGALVYFGLRATQSPQKGGFYGGVISGLIFGAMGCGPCALMSLG